LLRCFRFWCGKGNNAHFGLSPLKGESWNFKA
jgi:hypothetical protein